jgi:general secretion pathway protein D
MSQRRYDFIRAEQSRADPRVEPSIDELVREYLGTVPPGTVVEAEVEAAPEAEAEPPVPAAGGEIPPAMQETPQ